MSDEPKAVVYTGNDDDEVVVATTTESLSLWDQVESMMAAEITVGEVDALVHEIDHLRALITAWADAQEKRISDGGFDPKKIKWSETDTALRKAIGR